MAAPTVSIVVPVYNAEAYLDECLGSVAGQTFARWEAILVDDGSSDGSLGIARAYARRDARFRVVGLGQNSGQSAARNKGLSLATGDYVAFLDADDWWEPDFLQRHLAAIEGYDMVRSGYRRINGHSETERKLPRHSWQFTSVCLGLFRHSFIKGQPFQEGMYYEDVLWTVQLLIRKPAVRKIPYIGYNYRMSPGSTTSAVHSQDLAKLYAELRQLGPRLPVVYTYLKMKWYMRGK